MQDLTKELDDESREESSKIKVADETDEAEEEDEDDEDEETTEEESKEEPELKVEEK